MNIDEEIEAKKERILTIATESLSKQFEQMERLAEIDRANLTEETALEQLQEIQLYSVYQESVFHNLNYEIQNLKMLLIKRANEKIHKHKNKGMI